MEWPNRLINDNDWAGVVNLTVSSLYQCCTYMDHQEEWSMSSWFWTHLIQTPFYLQGAPNWSPNIVWFVFTSSGQLSLSLFCSLSLSLTAPLPLLVFTALLMHLWLFIQLPRKRVSRGGGGSQKGGACNCLALCLLSEFRRGITRGLITSNRCYHHW